MDAHHLVATELNPKIQDFRPGDTVKVSTSSESNPGSTFLSCFKLWNIKPAPIKSTSESATSEITSAVRTLLPRTPPDSLPRSFNTSASALLAAVARIDPQHQGAAGLRAALGSDWSGLAPQPLLGSSHAMRPALKRPVYQRALLYLPDRALDLLDVISLGNGFGNGAFVDVHATRALQLALALPVLRGPIALVELEPAAIRRGQQAIAQPRFRFLGEARRAHDVRAEGDRQQPGDRLAEAGCVHGDAAHLPDLAQQVGERFTRVQVEAREGLVQEGERRPVCERLREQQLASGPERVGRDRSRGVLG